MSRVLVFSWAGEVKLPQYGYEHNEVVEADLHTLIDFFLGKGLKIMVSGVSNGDYDYLLCVDNRMFTQR